MNSSVKRIIALILPLLLLLSGCGAIKSEESSLQRFSGSFFGCFDCTVTLIAFCRTQESFDALLAEVKEEFLRYHKLYDIYNSYPDIVNVKSLNDHAGKGALKVPEEILELLTLGKQMYSLTDGRMNIAMGSVLKLWHDVREYNNAFPDAAVLPDRAELEEAAAHCDIEKLIIDRENGTAELADGDMRLDVGAIAKGYAAECVARKLIDEGWVHVTLNAGGNARILGPKPDGSCWNVGIIEPDINSPKDYADAVAVEHGSVVTSGSYQRYFTYDGERYHHIIDPASLRPENRYLSVSVLLENSGMGDALSTALFNMDYEDGIRFTEGLDGVEAMWIFPDNSVKYSSGFRSGRIDKSN